MPAKELFPEIIADNREDAGGVIEELERRGAIIRKEQLQVGDFILSDRVCVERKTRNDFESSIIDGRLFQQAQAMKENFEKPVLIVEGESFEGRVHRKAVLGAISSLILDFSIPLFFTKDEDKTAELLFALAKREQITEKRPVKLAGEKRGFSLAQQQRRIIEAFPGVGPKLARSLLKKFKTIRKVVSAPETHLMKVEKIGDEKAKVIRKILTEEYKEDEDPEMSY